MRPLLHATLMFGLVPVPVGVCSTASRKDIKFRTLHKREGCFQPVSQLFRCEQCDMSHPEVTKGFEIAKGTFMALDQAEMDSFVVERDRVIDITKYVNVEEISPEMVEKSYFLQPNAKLHLPYEAFAVALLSTGTAGIGKATLWGKEYPVAVMSSMGVLVLKMLFCVDELVSDAELSAVIDLDVPKQELELAHTIIEMRRDKLNHGTDLVSDHRQRVTLYLQSKAEGVKLELKEKDPEPPTILNAAEAMEKTIALYREKVKS